MTTVAPIVNYLKEYQAPEFEIDSVYLTFDLNPMATVVTNTMMMRAHSNTAKLVLDGEELQLHSVKVNDVDVTSQCIVTDETLTVESAGLLEFKLEIVVQISPQQNTTLEIGRASCRERV